jgi:ubiquinone/menaquinone biosynthesis C-methylase UbiE
LGSEADGWFWDTEVMCRAFLNNLDVFEFPVLFLRRFDKPSTVKIVPTVLSYLWELYRFRSKVGLSLFDRSPIYWTGVGYDFLINLLYGERHRQNLLSVSERIPEGASVVEVCSGTGLLYRDHLKAKGCDYLGLDANGHFVMACQKRGVPTRLFNALTDDIPKADYVVMVSSMYHFQKCQDELMQRMLAAASRGVLISEPTQNMSQHKFAPFAKIANWLSNPGIGEYQYRYDPAAFERLAQSHGGVIEENDGSRNVIAMFYTDPESSDE